MIAAPGQIEATDARTRITALLRDIEAGDFSLPIGEELLPIGPAIKAVTGFNCSPPQACRYYLRGVRKILLPSIKLGGQRLTTLAWVRLWIAAQTAAANPLHETTDVESDRKPQRSAKTSRPAKASKKRVVATESRSDIDRQLDADGL